ncbi:MAG: ATP-binding protein, partial [Deinococcota bacterium]|nr:ATP-binding protein [Deinococcota bacterium]
MSIHERARGYLTAFEFKDMFVEELGWNPPPSLARLRTALFDGMSPRAVAELAGVMVFEVTSEEALSDAKLRKEVHKEVEKQHLEHLLIFVDTERSRSLWSWVKREGSKTFPREQPFVKGQPGDLLLSKLSSLVFDLKDFDDEGNISVVRVASRLKDALDVERTTKKFYREFQEQHLAFLELIEGIPGERERRWYASVLLNRLMFIYFLQRKGFVDGGKTHYLQDKLELMKQGG